MRKFALSKVQDDLPRFLRLAEAEEIVITLNGKPAAVLIGFKSEDDWFDYRFENDPRFLKRVSRARKSIREGRGIGLDKVREYFPNSAI
jgi:antitoxin (DNA-binding transcriptional repressor) of toxin-antitoxin stability system